MLSVTVGSSVDGESVPLDGDSVPTDDGRLVGNPGVSFVGTGVFPLCPNGASVGWPVAS